MESNLPKDIASDRHLIEGWGIPIDSGVFRRGGGHKGIVVDTQKLSGQKWWEDSLDFVVKASQDTLGRAVTCARAYMPINASRSQLLEKEEEGDRYSLAVFASRKNNAGQEVGGGSPDAQALFAALLIEQKLKNMLPEERGDRAVAVLRDQEDGHAKVAYKSKGGDIYIFDPTNGDDKFKKVENK